MKLTKQSAGLLQVEEVKNGDILIFTGEPEFKSSLDRQGNPKTYINIKVELPNGDKRLGTLRPYEFDKFIDVYGYESEEWVGKKAVVEIEEGDWGPFISLGPESSEEKEIEKSEEKEIKEEDIPF